MVTTGGCAAEGEEVWDGGRLDSTCNRSELTTALILHDRERVDEGEDAR